MKGFMLHWWTSLSETSWHLFEQATYTSSWDKTSETNVDDGSQLTISLMKTQPMTSEKSTNTDGKVGDSKLRSSFRHEYMYRTKRKRTWSYGRLNSGKLQNGHYMSWINKTIDGIVDSLPVGANRKYWSRL